MGMFDTIKFDAKSEHVKCAHGHPLHELQTKDFGADMDIFYIYDGKLFSLPNRETMGGYIPVDETWTVEGKVLAVRTMKSIPQDNFTGSVVAYTNCDKCDPVVFESPTSSNWRGEKVDGRQPWVEVELFFKEGILNEVKPINVETRDDVRKDMTTNLGTRVLSDDDRVAKRFIERYHGK